MTNLITAAKDKLDDPIMQEWAIHFYSGLPTNAQAERTQIETEWFHDFFIAQLIDSGDTSILSYLFRELPPQHFFNLTNLFIKNWSTWSRSVAVSAAKILAVNAPDQLLLLYKNDLILLQNGSIDPLKFSSIDLLFSEKERTTFTELVNDFTQVVINLKNDLSQFLLAHPILKLSKLLSADILLTLINKVQKTEASNSRSQAHFNSLFTGLFGYNNYLKIVFDRDEYESPLQLSMLQPFFVDSAPLEQLDKWLVNLPPLADVLTLLETVSEKSEGCRSLTGLLKDSKAIPEKTQIQLTLAACIHSFTKDTLDTSSFDLATTVNLLAIDLEYPCWNNSLINHLKSFDQAAVSELLISRLQEDSYGFAVMHIAEVMGELKYTEFIDPLINAIGKDKGDLLCDAAQKSLSEIGSSAQAELIAQWDMLDSSQQIYGRSVISAIHGTAANEFCLSRFSELLADDLEFACELIIASPDIRLIELLKPELRRKQGLIDRAFYISARLLDYDDPDVNLAKDRAFADHLHSKSMMEIMETSSLPQTEHFYLELKCPSCDAVNQYQTKGVIVSDEANIPHLLADEFPCASCAKHVEFQFTSMAHIAITAELLKKSIHNGNEHSQDSKVNTIDCKFDGQVMPLSKALSIINNSLVNKPKDAYQWFRLGNLISQINRPKATLNAYQQAEKYAPYAADAKFAFASALFNNQQEAEAFQILQDSLKQLSKWTFLSEFPDFGRAFADLYNHLRRSLGKLDIPAVHPSALSRPKKIGRNDPCSCGSGKKFKKCCGR